MKRIAPLVFSLALGLSSAAQPSADTLSVARYKAEAARMISFLEVQLNVLGDPSFPAPEKETVVFDSYRKIFRDEAVLVEDDLVGNRSASVYKEVQAYLKDVDFFFREARFQFEVQQISHGIAENGGLYLQAEVLRTLQAIDNEGDTVQSLQLRYIELNSDPAGQLKIASIYTQAPSQTDALAAWWNELPLIWKRELGPYFRINDTLTMAGVLEMADTAWVGDVLRFERREVLSIQDSSTLELFQDAYPGIELGDSLVFSYFDTLDLGLDRLAAPLRALASLESLRLSGRGDFFDLGPLSQLARLRSLDLSGLPVHDLFPLRGLTRLERLILDDTRVADLSPLVYCLSLRELSCVRCPLGDLRSLARMKQMELLDISYSDLPSLASLPAFPALRELRAAGIPAGDFEAIARLEALQELDLSYARVADLSFLAPLKRLEVLQCSSTPLSDLSPLARLPRLRVLYCEQTLVAELMPLAGIASLRAIYCDKTRVDIDAARRFQQKRPDCAVVFESAFLDAWWSGLSPFWQGYFRGVSPLSLSPTREELHQLAGVERLRLPEHAGIRSLQPLAVFTRLRELHAARNPVASAEELRGLPELARLDLSHSSLSNLDAVGSMPRLEWLDLSHTQVSSLAPLAGGQSLTELRIEHTQVSDLSPLRSHARLRLLACDHSAVSDSQALALMRHLPSLRVHYKTPYLAAWWDSLPPAWKDLLRPLGGGDPPASAAFLHEILFLKSLSIPPGSNIGSLGPVAELPLIEELRCGSNGIASLAPLASCQRLERLDISVNPVQDLAPLASLRHLRWLDCSATALRGLEPLASLVQIEYLACSGTAIRSLAPLQGLARLERLNIASTQVSSLRDIEQLAALRELTCFNTRVKASDIARMKKNNPQCQIIYY
jgi:Leucine-rich repeat (LRR) protein